ncbi:MAG: LAGLIDADG family homing endonuclease [Promethearchaeati archaeon]
MIIITQPVSSPTTPINPVQKFEDFYRFYEDFPGEYKYQEQIKNIDAKGGNSLVFLYEDLLSYDPKLAEMLKKDPERLLDDAVEAFKNTLKFLSGGKLSYEDYFVRISTLDEKSTLGVPIRGLRSKHIDQFVWLKGITIRSSTIRPRLTKATFECLVCGATFVVIQLTTKIKWPNFCTNNRCKAKAKSDFRLITKKSEFIDWQSITIQEVPEDLPSGRIPRSVQAILSHELVDYVKPGDRVKVMGIFRSVLATSMRSNNSTLFKTFIEVNYIDPEDKSEEQIDISKEEKEEILNIAKEPRIQKKIANSIAPTIYGRDELKMACALSLFGGTKKKKPDGGYKRGDIHVLFVGDPGTGKSEILKSSVDISPRGLYTSGKGSTAVGLTAAVIKDADTGQMNLEAGAMVLANGGVAAIDEFDKMDTADRSALHEGMEQQSYHYSTEIITADGNRIIIGEFIDNLMKKKKKEIISGNDCEILDFKDLKLYSTDFNEIFKTKVDRISRHKAPDTFYKIRFTNGRSITVTPEHPIFVFRDGKLKYIRAEMAKPNEFIPIPKCLPNSSKSIHLDENKSALHPHAKEISFPEYLNSKLSRILGYIVSEGHSYKGSVVEIGFSNSDEVLLREFKNLMENIFELKPKISHRKDGTTTLRYLSIELYKWMKNNFPEVMNLSIKKRIPSKILGGSKEVAREFLASAFKGDGSVESTSICYRTSSKGLSHDYQDLLLKLNLQSRIILDKFNDSYKVYIRGQSLIPFYEKIVEVDDKRLEKIKELIQPKVEKTHHHDVLPTSIAIKIIELKKELAIPYDGYYDRHLRRKHGITRNVFLKEMNQIKSKFKLIKKCLKKTNNITEIRNTTNYSQEKLAKISNIKRGNIDYYERGGYINPKREIIQSKILNSLEEKLKELDQKISDLIKLSGSDILWDRIKDIKVIQNRSENYTPWVYDITVEPNHTFISQGVILHNTVSIAKAGIVATLRAETAIIAAANPHSGRYDLYKTPTQNIRLPPSLLSRFDLIYVVIDRPNTVDDAQMAEFILKNAMREPPNPSDDEEGTAVIPRDLLKKYIKYAKRNCHPYLTKEAKEHIKEFYLKLRGDYDSEDAIVSILARNLDALVRLSEAYAKMALREDVLKEDVDAVIKLFERYLTDTGYDKTTGKIDMDRIFVGESRSKLNKLDKLLQRMKEIFEENNWKMLDKKNVIQILDLEEGLDEEFIKNALIELVTEGTLYEPRVGYIRFTNKEQ